MSTFLTSDTHFGHANIVQYCARPFRDVEEMNEELVRRWNEVVGPGDQVYHLGDFAMGPAGTAARWRARLNGSITLVLGNHDRSVSHMLGAGFNSVVSSLLLETRWPSGVFEKVVMRHRPPRSEAWRDEAVVYLHGHVHGEYTRQGDLINVGVDVRDFQPVLLDKLLDDPAEII